MIAGLPYSELRDAVLTYPTLIEGVIALFSSTSTHRALKIHLRTKAEADGLFRCGLATQAAQG